VEPFSVFLLLSYWVNSGWKIASVMTGMAGDAFPNYSGAGQACVPWNVTQCAAVAAVAVVL
jgi:hypothetical protein